MFDAVGLAGERNAIVEPQCPWSLRVGNTPVQSAFAVFGSADGFVHVAQEDRAGCQDTDVDHAEHFDVLDVGHEFGTVSATVCITIYRLVGLDDAHHLGHHIGCGPGRSTQVTVGHVALEDAVGANLVKRFLVAADDGRFFDMSRHPMVHIAIQNGLLTLLPQCSLRKKGADNQCS